MAAEQADNYLVEEIRSGNESAWRQLIDRYQGRLLAFARSRIASIADAEDVVQDTLIGFLQSMSRYDANRSLETYLFTILRYKITDYLRASGSGVRKLETQADDWWEEATPSKEIETPSVVAEMVESADAQHKVLAFVLRRLITELRDRNAFEDLQIVELLFYAGRRNKWVAKLLEVDEKHIAGVKFRAIGRVKKYLEEADESLPALTDDVQAGTTVCEVWREQRITCLKRGTLGQYLLGVLEDPWLSYTQFHLDVVGCPLCLANLQDLESEEEDLDTADHSEQIFASSVGFLSRAPSSTSN